uniref:Uncharacterized protein n=1 Tax=uncultured marine thaumarchaeote KM3_54_C03 TaxID=1456190 RepID=A0A075HA19_9ARCH|nr:hypothetical protein [uncultured marine thaumarchaeote KM3_54_C03]
MSGKDESVTSKNSLMGTKSGKKIIKQALFKSKGYKQFNQYKEEYETNFPIFAKRFANDLLQQIKDDSSPNVTQQKFGEEVGSTEIILDSSQIDPIKSKLENIEVLNDRVLRILNSNFVKMTFPVFNALFDASTEYYQDNNDPKLRENIVDGHIIAIDLSEPMDRIIDKDEDLDYLDDYKLMNPYILKLARDKIAKGGDEVLNQFESGFKDARVGQYLDVKLKQNPTSISEKELDESYKKYRSVMGTAGCNMALSRQPLGEIFRIGMGKASESVGCGNEIEDSIRDKAVKIPSWPLYYSLLENDVRKGFDLTMERSESYLSEARKALDDLPENFSHRKFLEFLFLTVEHYNEFWFNRLQKMNIWPELKSNLPK